MEFYFDSMDAEFAEAALAKSTPAESLALGRVPHAFPYQQTEEIPAPVPMTTPHTSEKICGRSSREY